MLTEANEGVSANVGTGRSESYYSKHAVSFRVSNSYFRDKKTRQQFGNYVIQYNLDRNHQQEILYEADNFCWYSDSGLHQILC